MVGKRRALKELGLQAAVHGFSRLMEAHRDEVEAVAMSTGRLLTPPIDWGELAARQDARGHTPELLALAAASDAQAEVRKHGWTAKEFVWAAQMRIYTIVALYIATGRPGHAERAFAEWERLSKG